MHHYIVAVIEAGRRSVSCVYLYISFRLPSDVTGSMYKLTGRYSK